MADDQDKKGTQLIGSKAQKQSDTQSKETTLMVSAVEKAINEQWLAKRTDDELIEIIVRVSDELRKRKQMDLSTAQIAKEDIPAEFREITDVPLAEYKPLPKKSDQLSLPGDRTWYVLLISADPEHHPLALKVMGDVVIGRKTEGAVPDVDLTDYGAESKGVSRMHAMLRPLPDQLIFSDLGSTNGTEFDGERLSLGKPVSVTDKGVMTLGKLHFQVRIMHKPGESGEEKEKDAKKKS
jgi:hypothetical protein